MIMCLLLTAMIMFVVVFVYHGSDCRTCIRIRSTADSDDARVSASAASPEFMITIIIITLIMNIIMLMIMISKNNNANNNNSSSNSSNRLIDAAAPR